MKIGDRVEVLDCIYEGDALCEGNFGIITEITKPAKEEIFMIKLDNYSDEDWPYLEAELRVIS